MEYIEIIYNKGQNIITSNDIMQEIEKACHNHGIENISDIENINGSKFENILQDVGYNLFKSTKALKEDNNIYNRYNVDKLKLVLELYIYLCNEYNKPMFLSGFYKLCGISTSYIYDTSNADNGTLNAFSSFIQKRLKDADKNRFLSKMDNSKQAVANIVYGNVVHNVSGTVKAQEMQTTAKTLADIKGNLSISDGQNANSNLL